MGPVIDKLHESCEKAKWENYSSVKKNGGPKIF